MTVTTAPSQDLVYQALETFLTGVLPAGVPVIRGLPNRAAMPQPVPGFVTMQALFRSRLRWNIDTWDTTNSAPTAATIEQGTEIHMQIDCYGASSADWANTISTLLRDPYGVAALTPNVVPLYADDGRMIPLTDSEQQYEERWSLDARLQFNPVTTIAQTFTNQPATIAIINVPEAYPP